MRFRQLLLTIFLVGLAGAGRAQTDQSATAAAQPFAETLISTSPGCSDSYSYGATKQNLAALTDLPESVFKTIEAKLIQRVGADFYQKMVFVSGYKLVPEAPAAGAVSWDSSPDAGVYYLCFRCNRLQAENGPFLAGLVADAQGNTVQPLNLPPIAQHPSKARIMSAAEARKIASRYGSKPPNSSYLAYRPATESLVWVIGKNKRVWRLMIRKVLYIDATNGELLKKTKRTRLRPNPRRIRNPGFR